MNKTIKTIKAEIEDVEAALAALAPRWATAAAEGDEAREASLEAQILGLSKVKERLVADCKAAVAAARAESCPFCGGRGVIPKFSHIANGVCFRCDGEGK